MTKFEYFYLKINFVQTYDLNKFILAKLYMVSHFSNWKYKCMFYTRLYPITKEIQLFHKKNISITLTIFYDIFLIIHKHHFIELRVKNILI